MDICQRIAELASLSYIELRTSIDAKVGLLKAMGILGDDFDYQTADEQKQAENFALLERLIAEKKDAEYINIVHHIPVLRQNRVTEVIISLPEGVRKLNWHFFEDEDPKKYYRGEVAVDNGEIAYHGEVAVDDLERFSLDDVTHTINGQAFRKYRFKFPFEVKLGYHQVEFEYENQNGQLVTQRTPLISAPEKCYDGLGIREGKKTWGVPVQLYEQVSENNLGIGNYSDLAHLGYILGKNGAGILGVNPIHANRDDQPENSSPYGPDCRMFFNYIYLDVTAVKEFKENKDIQDYYNSPEFQTKVMHNRRRALVDYQTTQELVDDILHRCFEKFKTQRHTEEHNRFNVYCDTQDGILDMYAKFRALNKYFSKQKPAPVDWTYWPKEYQNPNSEAFRQFVNTHQDEIAYYKYTQWLCEAQLQEVKEACLNSGMKIGLYTDTAVGALPKGFEAWYYSDLFIKGSAGATPDELSQQGQKWNLLGYNPMKLREYGYEPYRKILEANMRYAGCIRIDHVLQLQRLYMFPENNHPGSYVYYDVDELMALVALESHRNKTMVIGEDLGQTMDDFRGKMEDFGILSYKVMPFERNSDAYYSMKRPEDYPQMSTCATSTHDTPTLRNQWNVQDVYQKKMLGFITDKQADEKFEQYASQRESMNWLLSHYGCWSEVGGAPSAHPRQDANEVPAKYEQAVAAFLARSNSAIMLMPFSDMLGVSEMGNIPGVAEMEWSLSEKPLLEIKDDKSYPNWRKKMHIPIEHLEDVEMFREIVDILNRYRSDGNDGRGRFYQFERPGNNNASTIDFEKAKRLYKIVSRKEEYRFSALIRNRYSQTYKDRLDKHRIATQRTYQEEVSLWLKKQASGR